MKVRIAKWGNSLALRLPKPLADELGLAAGTEVDVKVEGCDMRVRQAFAAQPYRLEDLVAEMKRLGGREAEPQSVGWGADIGAEIIDDDYSQREPEPDDDGNDADVAGRR